MNRSGKRDHCQVDRGDRSAKAGIWHVARRARLISVGGDVLVVKHKLAECFYCLSGYLEHVCTSEPAIRLRITHSVRKRLHEQDPSTNVWNTYSHSNFPVLVSSRILVGSPNLNYAYHPPIGWTTESCVIFI